MYMYFHLLSDLKKNQLWTSILNNSCIILLQNKT